MEHSADLVEIYAQQAAERYNSGEFRTGKSDVFGKRITIEIALQGIGSSSEKISYLASGWLLVDEHTLRMTTPCRIYTSPEANRMIESYSSVQLLTDKYYSEGASSGDIGSVIEVYGGGNYEVEFADKDGIDFAQIVACEEELKVLRIEQPVTAQPAEENAAEKNSPRRKPVMSK